ncbi:MAG: hypothetical protein ACYDHP_06020 [Ferrimicrobium sp.]
MEQGGAMAAAPWLARQIQAPLDREDHIVKRHFGDLGVQGRSSARAMIL